MNYERKRPIKKPSKPLWRRAQEWINKNGESGEDGLIAAWQAGYKAGKSDSAKEAMKGAGQ